MTKFKIRKKILLILFLALGFGSALYIGFKEKVLAQEQSMVCPLKKMVAVGSLNDQTIASVNRILEQIQNVLDYSTYASLSATQLINLVNNGCDPKKCDSKCELKDENQCKNGTPPCSGYRCEYTTCEQNGSSAMTGNDCDNLPAGQTTIGADKYYYNATWCDSSCSSCSSCLHGDCIIEWNDTIQVCHEIKCQGDNSTTVPCPFSDIKTAIKTISDNRAKVETAAGIIDDFFHKNIFEFPEPAGSASIFGKFCNQVFLSYFCSDCFTTCTTAEFNALAFLESKAIDKINLCDIIKPEDIIAGKQGELLFTCKDVMPAPVLRCYLNDFFCCSAEEPK